LETRNTHRDIAKQILIGQRARSIKWKPTNRNQELANANVTTGRNSKKKRIGNSLEFVA
jgi:hypothetical protein